MQRGQNHERGRGSIACRQRGQFGTSRSSPVIVPPIHFRGPSAILPDLTSARGRRASSGALRVEIGGVGGGLFSSCAPCRRLPSEGKYPHNVMTGRPAVINVTKTHPGTSPVSSSTTSRTIQRIAFLIPRSVRESVRRRASYPQAGQPRPSRSITMPGNTAKRTDSGRMRNTKGRSIRISLRPAASMSARLASSRASTA